MLKSPEDKNKIENEKRDIKWTMKLLQVRFV